MLSREALESILGIEEKVDLTPEEMVGNLSIVFFPNGNKILSKNVIS